MDIMIECFERKNNVDLDGKIEMLEYLNDVKKFECCGDFCIADGTKHQFSINWNNKKSCVYFSVYKHNEWNKRIDKKLFHKDLYYYVVSNNDN